MVHVISCTESCSTPWPVLNYWSLVTRQPTNIFLTPNQLYHYAKVCLKYLNVKNQNIYLEPVCPWFLGLQPSKTNRLPRWFGFEFNNLKNIHIYIYTYIYIYTELADFLLTYHGCSTYPTPKGNYPPERSEMIRVFLIWPSYGKRTNADWISP